MSFCINCGNKIEFKDQICPYCFLDHEVPKEVIDNFLHASIKPTRYKRLIEYPGERSSLAFAVILTIAIGFIFSAITLGGFILLLLLGLTYLRIREFQIKRNYIKVSERNYPDVYNLSKVSAYRLRISLFPIYIVKSPKLNAYTSGFWGNHWIILHTRLVEYFSPAELLFILGHEMGHILREHSSWLNLITPTGRYSLPLINDALRVIFNNWMLKAEYSADRCGLIACGDLNSSISALVKLIADKNKIDLDAFLNEFKKTSSDPFSKISEYFGDHPFIPNRILKLKDFSLNQKFFVGGEK